MSSVDQNTALNSQVSEATLAARAGILSHTATRRRRQRHPRVATPSSAMHLVAEEIETVIFGESDSEQEEEEEAEDWEEGAEESIGGGDDERDDEQAFRPGDVNNTQPCSGASRPRRRRSRTRGRGRWNDPIEATDLANINSYTLFEMPGAGRGKGSRRSSSSSSIIYAKKYQSPGEIFRPILMLLGAMIVFLLAVEILLSLFNAVLGILVMTPLVFKVVQEFITRPVRFIRTVHSSPVLYMTILGATFGTLHALGQQNLMNCLVWNVRDNNVLRGNSLADSMNGWLEATSLCTFSSDASAPVDRVMMWGLLKGFVVGIEVGCLWLVVFGDSSNPTACSKYIHRRVWKHLKRQYRRSATLRRNQSRSNGHSRVLRVNDIASNCGVSLSEDHRNQCAICLDAFQDAMIDDENNGSDDGRNHAEQFYHDRYQLLPCSHCFHRECARHWLSIQRTCPVCREKVEGMRGYGPMENDDLQICNANN